ncbi:UDP-N-acetylglucosamine 4,6-dehydratase family protein [Paenibacillus sp. R14(2021)]|uniref:UDP-N-acetylglucosamine 4,6-dehydratase family protein n=1 Tax=Paenibacillus sp. R14(2021) TaxID=2859228 RepID=UPI0021584620|nr:polysaccharide biosynthesis protein [Paenibacillus sp. R14(2021)]
MNNFLYHYSINVFYVLLLLILTIGIFFYFRFHSRRSEARKNRAQQSNNHIPDIRIEEILGREPVRIDLEAASELVRDKVILVTGAGGSIGSEICRHICGFLPRKLILLGHGEYSIFTIENELKLNFPNIATESVIADIQDKKRLEDVFSYFQPHIIFHAAAHKHVRLMELNPSEAIKNNVFGTRNVAECALKFKAERLVFISSDKGVDASSVMGASKRLAEIMILAMGKSKDTKFVIVRFGNVLGSRGSVVPLFKQQIKNGGPIKVSHPDMVRYFMTIQEAVQLVFKAAGMATGGETFILDMGKPVKIIDLAYHVIRMSGLEPNEDIKIVFTGIGPGEKLVEELFNAEEKLKATKHGSIYVCEPHVFLEEDVFETLRTLEEIVSHEEMFAISEEIYSVIRQFIPGFKNTGQNLRSVDKS